MKRKRLDGYFGFIYLMKMDKWIKIGRNKIGSERHREYNTKLPVQPEYIEFKLCVDFQRLEKLLHKKFKDFNTNGEWYILNDIQIDAAKNIMKLWCVKDQAMLSCVEKDAIESIRTLNRKGKSFKEQMNEIAQLRRLKVESKEKGINEFLVYINSLKNKRLYAEDKLIFKQKMKGLLGITNRTLGINTLNRCLSENGLSYEILSIRDTNNRNGRKNCMYWEIFET